MKLSDNFCKHAKPQAKPYKVFDGGGLYLLVSPTGYKSWNIKYRYLGKDKKLTIGQYPTITLKEARDSLADAKKLLARDIDPIAHKKAQKLELRINSDNTFKKLALEWHDAFKNKWTDKHAIIIMKRLEADILPHIGNMSIADISAPILLDVLRKIEKRGALDIAKRMKQTTGQILRYGVAVGKAERDITHDLRDAMQASPAKQSHNYLVESDLPELCNRLNAYHGDKLTRLAMLFTIHTFTRTGEVIGAEWHEIDFAKKQWRIPASRMKMRTEHIVPLSEQVIALLNQIKQISHNSQYLFPSKTSAHKPISNNTMLYALYRIGYHDRATMHGFRSTASTILNENNYRSDVIEKQLSHGERNNVRAAYNHAEYLPERIAMMQWYSDYIDNKRLIV